MVKRLCTLVLLLTLALSSAAFAAPIIFSVGGDATPASIQSKVDEFRTALGNPNNGNAGPQAGGRREINWDGGGSDVTALGGDPFNVFLNLRGAQFVGPGSDFVQAPETGGPQGGLATLFGNATYGTTFNTFSSPRLFAPVGSNIIDALFFAPGTNGGTQATTKGFGMVFTDVDLPTSTSLTFFDLNNNILGGAPFFAEIGIVPDGSLSFLGVLFTGPTENIARVRIVMGNAALGPNDNPGGGVDVVAMDDALYGEPQFVPEPATLVLVGAGAVAAALIRRRRGAATD